jgi:biotin carboxyl carrier protein
MDIAYSRPRFRTDLVAKPFDEAGQRFVDVTDPDSGKTFRFYEIEYSIACAMDGRRDLAGLAEWAHAELGVEPSRDELATVISTLDDLGYLEQGGSARSGFDLGTAGATVDDDAEEALASGDEFELGNAGKSPLDLSDEERLDAPELTLGVSGNELVEMGPGELPATGSDYDETPTTIKKVGNLRDVTGEMGDPLSSQIEPTTVQPVLRPVSRARTNDEEGPTNIPPPVADFDEEVSVDLTDHMRIGAADVKEAVRQSKVMQAVEIPPELGQKLSMRSATTDDDEDGSATTEHEAPRLAPPPGPLPRMQTPPPMPSSTAAPTELPEVPAFLNQATPLEEDSGRAGSAFRAERSESAPVAVEKKSRVGLLLLILVLVGVGAGTAYYFLIYLPAQQAAPVEPPPVPPEPVATPEPPPTPPRPSAKLAATPVDPVPVTASAEGEIKEILASGAEVTENDIVVKLAGYEAAQRTIDGLMSDVDRYQKRIAAAEEKKQKAEAASAGSGERYQKEIERDQQKIADREQDAEAARKEMEPYLVRAPISGKIATERAAGQKVAAGDAVFSIELPPRLQAIFTVETGEVPGKHAEVKLAAKADESKVATCRVAEINGREVTVICPGTDSFADGAEVVLLP